MTTRDTVRTIYLATDHAGFSLKEVIKNWLLKGGEYTVVDCGAKHFEPGDDFPDYIALAAKAVSTNPKIARAIIIGGSGQGEAMLANRFSNVRATTYYGHELDIIRLSREHNDANILSLGARFMSNEEALEAVALWLQTEVELDERHIRRTQKIEIITRELRNL